MEHHFRVIVAGGRDFSDRELTETTLNNLLQNMVDVEIVSGCAAGADTMGELYAEDYGLAVAKFPADWDKYGKRAGYLRNKQMAEYATHCVCFWDGKSKGTKMMIELAKDFGLPLRVIKY